MTIIVIHDKAQMAHLFFLIPGCITSQEFYACTKTFFIVSVLYVSQIFPRKYKGTQSKCVRLPPSTRDII